MTDRKNLEHTKYRGTASAVDDAVIDGWLAAKDEVTALTSDADKSQRHLDEALVKLHASKTRFVELKTEIDERGLTEIATEVHRGGGRK